MKVELEQYKQELIDMAICEEGVPDSPEGFCLFLYILQLKKEINNLKQRIDSLENYQNYEDR